MKNKPYTCSVATIIIICICLVSACIPFGAGSPLVTGKWDGDVFTNEWTRITFELPSGFSKSDGANLPRGLKNDFTVANEDNSVLISLTYFDVSKNNDTAEDYLSSTRAQLADSPNKSYTFQENSESMTIAGNEYAVMRSQFFFDDNPTKVFHQDGYSYRFVNTMMVFIAVYTDDTKDSVDSFLASINDF